MPGTTAEGSAKATTAVRLEEIVKLIEIELTAVAMSSGEREAVTVNAHERVSGAMAGLPGAAGRGVAADAEREDECARAEPQS
mmetsp:Transcript_112769/g.211478  ORF Transcript_112769/g.211478 Transcript_112769/m.211478 type:complete len:83 (+) Transcript_112769:307-555(+)